MIGTDPSQNTADAENGPPLSADESDINPTPEPAPGIMRRISDRLNAFFTTIRKTYQRRFQVRKCPYCLASIINERHRFVEPNMRICLCSNCDRELPTDFFRNKSHIITLIGGSDSSKTTFITVLAEQAQQSQGMLVHLDTYSDILGEEAQRIFYRNQHRLYVSHTTVRTTIRPDRIEKTPFVMRVSKVSNSKSRSTFISLFDSPGEVFKRIDLLTEEHPHIGNSDAIIYLINPLDIHLIHNEIADSKKYKNMFNKGSFDFSENDKILNNIYEIFQRARRTTKHQKINIPIAFCISKSDLLDSIATFYTPDDINSDLLSIKDINEEILYTSKEMEDYLMEYDKKFVIKIKSKFNKYALFPVSPIGKLPEGESIPGGPEPRGVLHPLFWLLTELKFMQ